MKRQLRPILAAVALLCAPLAWSQSGFPDSTLNTSSDPQQTGATNSSQSGAGDVSQSSSGDASQSGAGDTSQSGSGDTSQIGAGDTSQSGLGGPQDTFSHPEKLPPLNLFNDAVSHTGYSFNFSAGTMAQYVSAGNGLSSYWDNYSLFSGGISIVQARPKLLWSAGYTAGVNTTVGTTNYGNYSNVNQLATAQIIWQLASRWQFRLKDTYFYSDDPFQPFYTYIGQPLPNYPNPIIYFPQTVVEQNQATADLTYLLGAHDSVDFTGGESFQRFLRGVSEENLPGFSGLWDSVTYSGGGFYQHLFSSKLAAGEGYVFTALDFGHGQSRAGVQTFQTFASYKFSPRLQVSGWVGPELTGTKDLVPVFCLPSGCLVEIQRNSYFNVAEGGSVSWIASSKNAMGLQYVNSITNGGGVFGAVKFYQVTATYGRPLTRKWRLGAGFVYANSSSISNYNGSQYLYSSQGTVSLGRQLNEALTLNTYYSFIHQTQNYYGLLGVPVTLTTSGVGFTIRYTWNHALGR